jgi:hypothetical protein
MLSPEQFNFGLDTSLRWHKARFSSAYHRIKESHVTLCPTTYPLAQCRKTVMTPLKNIQRTRTIKGYLFYENLRPNQQLDVLGYMGFLQNLLKTFIFKVFSFYLPNRMKNFTLSGLFFHLYLASKGDQNTFYLFQSSN